jgi:hypothetical protein
MHSGVGASGCAPPQRYKSSMLSKPVLIALLAACGVNPSTETTDPPTEQPDKKPPDETVKENVYFCCQDADLKTASGEGCLTIGEKEIDRCNTVLACADGFIKKDGKVFCL